MSKLQEKPTALVGHFALLDPDPDTESGTSLNPIHSGYGSGSESIALVLLMESCVVSRGPAPRMAAKRRSGRVTKQEVKYFKEESSDEDEEEVS
jgi:hypothetical protein